VPTERLKLDDRSGGLLLHGITMPTISLGSQPPTEVEARRVLEVVEDLNATYVLQVEGVDISLSHPDIDWSRHLPPDVVLERKEHDKILNLSFKFFTFWCFRVVPSLFLRGMYHALSVPRSEEPPRTQHYSPMLHNALLSLSTVYSDQAYLRDPKTRLCFVRAAEILQPHTKPDLSMIQALSLLGTYYSDSGDRIRGELYFGV